MGAITTKSNRHMWRYLLWPISVWMSVKKFDQHASDDYVELTSPILATAIAFWAAVASIAAIWVLNGLLLDFQLLLWMTPLIYAVGLALYVNRERTFESSEP